MKFLKILFLIFIFGAIFFSPFAQERSSEFLLNPIQILKNFRTGETSCKTAEEKLGVPFLKIRNSEKNIFEYYQIKHSQARGLFVGSRDGKTYKQTQTLPVDGSIHKLVIYFDKKCYFQNYLYFTNSFPGL